MTNKTYQQISALVHEDLVNLCRKHRMDMDELTDHFSMFLAKYIIDNSSSRTVDALNIVHSFSRYVMALEIDEKNGIK